MWIGFSKSDKYGYGIDPHYLRPPTMDDIAYECSGCGKIINKATTFCPECGKRNITQKNISALIEKIKVKKHKRKRGIWIVFDIFDPSLSNNNEFECSECGKRFSKETNFCPCCGASMVADW